MQQGVQTQATCNIKQCWELLANNVASDPFARSLTTKTGYAVAGKFHSLSSVNVSLIQSKLDF